MRSTPCISAVLQAGLPSLVTPAPPSQEREMDTFVTFVLDESSHVHSLWKPGGTPLSDQLLRDCLSLAKQCTSDILQKLQKAAPS